MKIEEGKFYFLNDSFFEEMKDNNLASNKDNGNKREGKYCVRNSTKGEESSISRYNENERNVIKRIKKIREEQIQNNIETVANINIMWYTYKVTNQ